MRRNAGLSLIEICIALIVIGLLMIPVIYEYQSQIAASRLQMTDSNFFSVRTALQQYFFANNRFPCPADPTLTTTSGLYGQEEPAPGACTTNANIKMTAGNLAAKGAVPFKALNIPAALTFDGWGRKLAYVVTTADTIGPFNPANGQLSTIRWDQIQRASQTTDSNLAFLVFSYGDDGLGAYSDTGTLVGPCPVAAPQPAEAVNCSNGTAFRRTDFQKDTAPGIGYFDDVLDSFSYLSNLDSTMWAYSPPTGTTPAYTNIFSKGNVGVGPYIGAGTFPAWPLDVVGNVLAVTSSTTNMGNADALNFCDPNGQNCFQAAAIGGTGMGVGVQASSSNCPTGTAMTGIAGQNTANPGFALCNTSAPVGTSQNCNDPNHPYVMGIGPGETIICGPP